MKCQLLLSSTNHHLFSSFWPIWTILAWADRPVRFSFSGLREKRKKYSIGKLGCARVRAESGTQGQLKGHGAVLSAELFINSNFLPGYLLRKGEKSGLVLGSGEKNNLQLTFFPKGQRRPER